MTMIKTILKTTALLVLAVAFLRPAAASTVTLGFGSVSAGSAANNDPAAIAAGITFDGGLYDYSYDSNGLPIPGTLHWQIDALAPAITIESTTALGWGTPSSGTANALDARFSPVLMHLAGPSTVNSLSFTLPNSTLGTLGASQILFLGAGGSVLSLFNYAQGSPNATFTMSTAISGVTDILFASGTLYRNITLDASPVPLPAALPLLLSGLGLLGVRGRRLSSAC
jgi:hypothetical protein